MDEVLQQILNELKEIKEGQIRIEKKLESVHEHTAKITEDITEANMKIDKICLQELPLPIMTLATGSVKLLNSY